jgi:hypothetical protein
MVSSFNAEWENSQRENGGPLKGGKSRGNCAIVRSAVGKKRNVRMNVIAMASKSGVTAGSGPDPMPEYAQRRSLCVSPDPLWSTGIFIDTGRWPVHICITIP